MLRHRCGLLVRRTSAHCHDLALFVKRIWCAVAVHNRAGQRRLNRRLKIKFLSLGLCWCLKVGTLLDEYFPLPLKRHGRRSESVFPHGVQELQCHLCRLAGRRGNLPIFRLLQELDPVC